MVRQRGPPRRRAWSRGHDGEPPRRGVRAPHRGARARLPALLLLQVAARGAAHRLGPLGRAQHARLAPAAVPGAGAGQLGHSSGRVPHGRDAALHGSRARRRAHRRPGERSDRDRRYGALRIARRGGSRRAAAHAHPAAARRGPARGAPDGPLAGVVLRRPDARGRPHRLGLAHGAGSQFDSGRGAAVSGRLYRPRRPAAAVRGIALARRAGAAPRARALPVRRGRPATARLQRRSTARDPGRSARRRAARSAGARAPARRRPAPSRPFPPTRRIAE